MRHPIGRVIGTGLFVCRTMAQQRLLGTLFASVAVHVVLLNQLLPGTRDRQEPGLVPAVLMVKLLIPAPSMKPLSPVITNARTERANADKHYTPSAVRQSHASVAGALSDVATPSDTQNREPIELPLASDQTNLQADHRMDLSEQAIIKAVRRNASPSLAQAAREQLGIEPATAAARFGQHIASGAVPDCLHNAPDGEVKSSPAGLGGLLALPFVAYAVMTGKCK